MGSWEKQKGVWFHNHYVKISSYGVSDGNIKLKLNDRHGTDQVIIVK